MQQLNLCEKYFLFQRFNSYNKVLCRRIGKTQADLPR